MSERVEQEAWFIIEHEATIRETAGTFRRSKSTIYNDMKVLLPEVSSLLSQEVYKVFQKNKAEAHIRGGEATRKKFEH